MSKKIAFCFLIYDIINHEELWNNFFKDVDCAKYNIYIHYKTNIDLKYFNKYKLSNCIETKWGDISLVKAQNLLLEEAVKDNDNQHFIFISNSCIPLKTFDRIILDENFSYFNMCPQEQCFPRCNKLLTSSNSSTPSNSSTLPSTSSNLPSKKHIQKSHQWCILNRKHTILLITETDYLNWFQNFGDEHCYITKLFTKDLTHEIINKVTTFVDWSSENLKNYSTISKEELNQLKNGECFFGRKFDKNCIL